MSSGDQWTWPAMLATFRALGGVAENIRLSDEAGTRLQAQDTSRPVSLTVPPNLCFALDDIEFVGDNMALKQSANVGPGERSFFDAYSRAFSWGAGAGAATERFIATLDALPSEARSILAEQIGMPELFAGDSPERTRKRFLLSKRFRWNHRDWFVPIAELARHGGRGLVPAVDSQRHFSIQGTVPGEVLVARGAYDTMHVFFTFGVVEPQEQAYSFPVNFKDGATDVSIQRNTARSVVRRGFVVPEVFREDGSVTFSFLMIGHVKFPRLSRGVFVELARDTPIGKPDEAFDYTLFANRMLLLNLLAVLEPHHGEAVTALRRVVHIQLERISHCIGTRTL